MPAGLALAATHHQALVEVGAVAAVVPADRTVPVSLGLLALRLLAALVVMRTPALAAQAALPEIIPEARAPSTQLPLAVLPAPVVAVVVVTPLLALVGPVALTVAAAAAARAARPEPAILAVPLVLRSLALSSSATIPPCCRLRRH